MEWKWCWFSFFFRGFFLTSPALKPKKMCKKEMDWTSIHQQLYSVEPQHAITNFTMNKKKKKLYGDECILNEENDKKKRKENRLTFPFVRYGFVWNDEEQESGHDRGRVSVFSFSTDLFVMINSNNNNNSKPKRLIGIFEWSVWIEQKQILLAHCVMSNAYHFGRI